MRSLSLRLIIRLGYLILPALANVEKIVFIAPDDFGSAGQPVTRDSVDLDILSPTDSVLRTHLPASFPSTDRPLGTESWFLLDQLQRHKRYELRVCWAATQPTSFHLEAYSAQQTSDDADLTTSLALFSRSRDTARDGVPLSTTTLPKAGSLLFLRIFAAADYYSTNKTLMQTVAPVKVDLILDPYHFNIFPRSLQWTACYLGLLTLVAWQLSAFISRKLHQVGQIIGHQDVDFHGSKQGATNDVKKNS